MTYATPHPTAPPDQVVAGILRFGDLSLLCHRAPDRTWYPNVWDLPGGHVEHGETPMDALRRELREELGIEAETVSSEPVARIREASFDLRVYVVNTWAGCVENRCPQEHDAISWFGPHSMHSLDFAHPALPALLRHLPSGRVE